MSPIDVTDVGVGMPLPLVTFDLYHALLSVNMSLRTQVRLQAVPGGVGEVSTHSGSGLYVWGVVVWRSGTVLTSF